jgi:hypothetical protein
MFSASVPHFVIWSGVCHMAKKKQICWAALVVENSYLNPIELTLSGLGLDGLPTSQKPVSG